MRKSRNWIIGSLAGAVAVCASGASGAATLEDIVARLESLQRDNQAMRKEISVLRQQTRPQPGEPRNARAVASEGRAADPQDGRSAMAADLSSGVVPRPLAYTGPYDWSGFYVGANGGYASGSETSTLAAGTVFSHSTAYEGLFGGGQIGFNIQHGNFVIGMEADMQFGDIGGKFHQVFPPPGALFTRNSLDAFATARGRVGYAFDRLLPYVTGGVAVGRNTFEAIIAGDVVTDSAVHTGWTAGGGLEFAVRGGWSVKAEYLHVDLGSQSYIEGLFAPGVEFLGDLKFDLVRAGVNYRF